MELEIDSLLNEHDRRKAKSAGQPPNKPEPSPLDQLRDKFREEFVPLVERIASQYGPKGVSVSMNAENFLEGGRIIVIDVAFGGFRIVQEGTVMPDSIAFSEVHHAPNRGETMSAGQTIRGRQLTEEGMSDFILKSAASLIRAANRTVRA